MSIPSDASPWNDDWTVGVRAWVERAGQPLLGQGHLELLEGIDHWHSISEAARQLGISYRHAWLMVQSVNEAAGEPFVVAAPGGRHGGGAQLTPHGRGAVRLFRQLQAQLQQAAASLLPRLIHPPQTPSVHVAAAVSLEAVLGQLLAAYSLHQRAVRVRVIYGASDELADHLLAGTPADLFLTADEQQLERLEAAQLVGRGTRTALAENTLAAVGRADDPVPVRRPADLARLAAGRLAVAEPSCPLGRYTRTYLEQLGVCAAVLPRALAVDNSRAVLDAVRGGQADIGLVYGSDAARAAGCQVLFQARKRSVAIRYTAAVVDRGQPPGRAQALLDFLTSGPAGAYFRRCGFLPVQSPGPRKRRRQ